MGVKTSGLVVISGCHRCCYGPEVTEALVPLWKARDRLCDKRLNALLPLQLESLERQGHLALDLEVREKLLAISSAMIDRVLASVRKTNPAPCPPGCTDPFRLKQINDRTKELTNQSS
jgi:hypothetical protein